MYRLLFEDRTLSHEPFVTREPLVFIGRDAACSLRLAENGVSDRHAAIERREDGYYVRDLGSANGVRVNGQLVASQRLTSGDELEVGSVRLRFEIVHEPPSHRRPLDLLQVAAVAIVALIILGQLVLFGWIFSESRPRRLRTDMGSMPARPQATSVSPANPGVPLALGESLTPQERGIVIPTAPATTPPVLNRMIKIQRVDRRDDTDGVTLQIQVKAQVGERELDTTALAIGVQFIASPEAKTVWVNFPVKWENFTARTFTARYAGSPRQLQGYVVRTYYRKQLQDAVAMPPSLLTTASTPTP
jgi:predicted component of type VI protein secretion system